jgi:AraC-like DNA-binding protein
VIINQYPNNQKPLFSFQVSADRKGNSTFISKDDANNLILTFYYSGQHCDLPVLDKANPYMIKIIFSAYYLEHYFPYPSENHFYKLAGYKEEDICCNNQLVLHEILNCKLDGIFKIMFLESKALSLLLSFQSIIQTRQYDCDHCKFISSKPLEKPKLLKAKAILLELLTDPPTIPELSQKVGMNQCYLKKGFKELFGTTIHDFVQQQRMLKAKLLLISTDYSVAEVADKIGFSSTSNFSAAFKKYMGIMPSMMQKTLPY